MDKIFSRAVDIIGSTQVVFAFLLWLIYHSVTDWQYLSFISELAIFLALVIVRGQIMDARYQRSLSERDLAATKRIENKLS